MAPPRAISPECNSKHSREPDSLGEAQARLGSDEVRRVAGSSMDPKERAVGPRDVTTGAPEYVRHDG